MKPCLRSAAAALLLVLAPARPFAQQPARSAQGEAPAPTLIVVLVVDQMRADYLERYSSRFTGGLRRLMEEGAWFRRAAYPYLNTVTCAGHSTIGTGALPYRHGMILNAWYDRAAGKPLECTDDDREREISYSGGLTGVGESGRFLLVPTLADQLRERAKGRVVSLSIKARSAIGMAGQKADALLWFDERGAWATSSSYAKAPVPFLQRFIDQHPVSADLGKTWERTLDAAAYRNADDGVGERAPSGWTRTFPHAIGTPGGKPDAAFYAQWTRSPYADEYLGRLAAESIDAMSLGKGAGTDFLGVSFSSLDYVGHAFGPNSHEVQDMLVRLDLTIGRLIEHLDTKVGRGHYVLGLSSDHGVADLPEQVNGGGRQSSVDVAGAIDAALQPIFGPGRYALYAAYTDIYLAPGVRDSLKANPRAAAAVLAALRKLPGILQVFQADELSAAALRTGADPLKRAAALSYYAGRSGDLILVPRENWLLSSSATTHGTQHAYDQRVPLILFGPGVAKGTFDTGATPADLAPTLAALARVAFKATDGRVLSEAVTSAASTK